jgi:deazaflavin-dependent oxidoreductase (nitroreductase family)
MPAPRWLARFNLVVTNRILGPLANQVSGMGTVLHVGRETHRQHRTPVMVFRRGNRFVIALTYGPQSEWVQNVIAANGCEFETEGRTLHFTNPVIVHDERRSAMPAFVRFMLGILNVSDFLELSIANGT